MPTIVICACGKKLRIQDDLAGKDVPCPRCGKTVAVPQADEPEEISGVVLAQRHQRVSSPGTKPKVSRRALLCAAVGTVVLLGVGVGCYFLFLRDNASSNEPDGNKSTHQQNSSGNTKGEAMITATPNPVPAGPGMGKATISWDTGDKTIGEIYVSANGGPEKRFGGNRPKGTQEANWIGKGEYEFRLYAGKDRAKLLARVTVIRRGKK
jgi:hypothetical protein